MKRQRKIFTIKTPKAEGNTFDWIGFRLLLARSQKKRKRNQLKTY